MASRSQKTKSAQTLRSKLAAGLRVEAEESAVSARYAKASAAPPSQKRPAASA